MSQHQLIILIVEIGLMGKSKLNIGYDMFLSLFNPYSYNIIL